MSEHNVHIDITVTSEDAKAKVDEFTRSLEELGTTSRKQGLQMSDLGTQVRGASTAMGMTVQADKAAADQKQALGQIIQRLSAEQSSATSIATRSMKLQKEALKEQMTGYRQLSTDLRQYGRVVRQIAIGIFILSMVMNRVRDATWAAEDAERRWKEAIEDSSSSTKEIDDAGRNLERTRIRLDSAQKQAVLTTGIYLVSLSLELVRTWALIKAKGIKVLLTGQEAVADTSGAVATTLKAGADATHTSIIWGKVAALRALATAQVAGIPVIGWIAAIGGAIAVGAAISQSQKARQQAAELPQGQTGIGYMRRIERTGVMVGHEGEVIGRPTSRGGGKGVTVSIDKVVLDPRGRDVRTWAIWMGRMIKTMRPEVY